MTDAVNWDALAAEVLANLAATGQWFAAGAPHLPDPVDWNAVAADVLANLEATGQWFLAASGAGQGLQAVIHFIGSGPDAVVLRISQDAFRGPAQYTIGVDGEQIDGTLSAVAERRFGLDDTIVVQGRFGAGQHTLTVNFVNDAWGGTPDTDRNLYVDGARFQGQALPDSTLSLFSNGAQSITFSVAPLPGPVHLVGTDGPDRLQETLAHGDEFLGGPGADTFAFGIGVLRGQDVPSGESFGTILGTGVGPGDRDLILDFRQGEDVIDLSAALQFARRGHSVDEAFRFIGTAPFGGTGLPELRTEASGDRTIIQVDGTGSGDRFFKDGTVDAEIEIVGLPSLTSDDFIL